MQAQYSAGPGDTPSCIDLVRYVHDIPYQFIGSRDVADMFESGVGTCTAKHAFLKQILEEAGYTVQFIVDSFLLTDFLHGLDTSNTIVQQLVILGKQLDPYYHTYLQLQQDGTWITLDISFDPALQQPYGFAATEYWDGVSNMILPHTTIEQYKVNNPAKFKNVQLANETKEQTALRRQFFALLNSYIKTFRS